MSKLDQKIQEINAKILALDGKKSRFLAIKFGAKGGEGSGRYPKGSGEARNTIAENMAKYTRQGVGSLQKASWAREQIDTTQRVEFIDWQLRQLGITAIGQVYETIKDGGGSRDADPLEVVKAVQSVLNMHPADYRDAMLNKVDGVGKDTKLTFNITVDKEYGKTTIFATLDDGANTSVGEVAGFQMIRRFTVVEKGFVNKNTGEVGDGKIVISNDMFKLAERDQSQGFGKQITSNLIDVADHIGASKIEMEANINIGGYAWARYGFAPSKEGFKDFTDRLIKDNSEKIAALTPSQKKELDDIIKPKMLFNAQATLAMQDLSALDFKDPSAKFHFGKDLLIGSDWFGSIDLDSKLSYGIIRAYCAKRK